MESITKYYRRVQATFILTAFCVIAAAVLFAPSFGRFVHTGDNVADILLNGVVVGCTDEPEKAEDILQSAREELVRDNQELGIHDGGFGAAGEEYGFRRGGQ